MNWRKTLVRWETYRSGGKKVRDHLRKIRINWIKDHKEHLLVDLMTGHNLGDYEFDSTDLPLITRLSSRSPYAEIERFYLKYRGVKIEEDDFDI
jgi:hypothetical protein